MFLFSGSSNDDADFERYMASIDELDASADGRADAAVVTVVDKGNPPPDAKWRKRIGERSRTLKTRAVAALVSTSPIIRGVVTVLNWVAPSRFEEQVAVATFEEAIAWIESKRGPRRTVLNVLLREARADAERRSKA